MVAEQYVRAGGDCIMCEEPITNPICPACLQEGVQQWLMEQGKEDLVNEVQELTRGVFANHGDAFCIKCNSVMALCAYCYTKEVFSVIKDHPSLVTTYLTHFNFDLEHNENEVLVCRNSKNSLHLGWEQDALAYID